VREAREHFGIPCRDWHCRCRRYKCLFRHRVTGERLLACADCDGPEIQEFLHGPAVTEESYEHVAATSC
jgi:hypothetical protein